jgi:integrase
MEESVPLERDAPKRPRLLEQVRDAVRRRHYSHRTEETYVHWIKRFIYFSGKRYPGELGAPEVTAFLNYLAREREVAAATQNQALSALLFLYREVLGKALPWLDDLERARRPARMPTVLSREEAQRLLAGIQGTKWLMASLLYGAGLRLRECLKLRVKDVDFGYRQILVRDGKGAKDRVTMLPDCAIEPLKSHLLRARAARARSGGGLRRCRTARRDRAQVPARAARMGLEVRVPVAQAFHRSAHRCHSPPPRVRELPNSRGQGGRARRRHRKARELPHVAAFVRHASARSRLRHPHRAGAPRSRKRGNNDGQSGMASRVSKRRESHTTTRSS